MELITNNNTPQHFGSDTKPIDKLPDEAHVVYKAFLNACKALNVSRDDACKIIGVDKATLSRNKQRGFSPRTKTGELCLLFVRLYRSLFAIAGGDIKFMQHWLKTHNTALSGTPLQLTSSIQGLMSVNMYLDAMRGKV